MTRDEMLALEGRELNDAVAEYIFGYTFCPIHHRWTCCGRSGGWSQSVNAAWQVVEKMRKKFFRTAIYLWDHTERVAVCFVPRDEDEPDVDVTADTFPIAICRAALLAVMEVE